MKDVIRETVKCEMKSELLEQQPPTLNHLQSFKHILDPPYFFYRKVGKTNIHFHIHILYSIEVKSININQSYIYVNKLRLIRNS